MTKTIFRVYRRTDSPIVYVTTKRNTEDIMRILLDMYYAENVPLKITRTIGNETVTVFTPNKNNIKFWNLETPH